MTNFMIFLCFYCASTYSRSVVGNITDDAEEALDQLKTIVRSDVLLAQNALKEADNNFTINTYNIYGMGVYNLGLKMDNISSRLNDIKTMANSSGVNISGCLNGNEDTLNDLPFQFVTSIDDLINNVTSIEKNLLTEADSSFILSFNEAIQIGGELSNCKDDQCIETIIEKIEQNKIQIPLDISSELNSTLSLLLETLDQLQIDVETQDEVYFIEAMEIIDKITACVNDLTI